VRARVIVASNRAAAGVYEDRSGPILVKRLRDADISVDGPVVVPDGEPVAAAIRAAIALEIDVVITSGGTGLTSTDLTPDVTRELIDREIPGLAEEIRRFGAHGDGGSGGTPFALLSRGVAGLAGRTLIVNLAGSTGAARDGMRVLAPLLGHLVDQINDGDHRSPEEDI
jgi:molybdenum cofactor synthesis domain-containing protein